MTEMGQKPDNGRLSAKYDQDLAARQERFDASKSAVKEDLTKKAEAVRERVGNFWNSLPSVGDAINRGYDYVKAKGQAAAESPYTKLALSVAEKPLTWAGKLEGKIIKGMDWATEKVADGADSVQGMLDAAKDRKANNAAADVTNMQSKFDALQANIDALQAQAEEHRQASVRLAEQQQASGNVDKSERQYRLDAEYNATKEAAKATAQAEKVKTQVEKAQADSTRFREEADKYKTSATNAKRFSGWMRGLLAA